VTGATLPIAHRVWAEAPEPGPLGSRTTRRRRHKSRARRRLPEPSHVLIFDTETTTDQFQSLLFGCWRLCRVEKEHLICVTEGLLYADNLATTDPGALEMLRAYAATRRASTERDREVELLSRSEFVERVFYRAAYKLRAQVVGFNLPFDLARLAVGVAESRAEGFGGISLILWEGAEGTDHTERRHRPRLIIKALETKGAFISFSKPMAPDRADLIPEDSIDGLPDDNYAWRGRFVDCATLAYALTGVLYGLNEACRSFGVEGKAPTDGHGQITDQYVDYCRQDVAATQHLYQALMVELRRHPIDVPPERAYSPATLAKSYLAVMGLTPLLDRNPRFRRRVLGYAMAAFFGGRAECRIRRVPVPIQLVDFTSMYPTVGALVDLHRLQIASEIAITECTAWLRELLATVTLEDCLDPQFWPQLTGFALIEPAGHVLPVRAAYDGVSYGIGVNPLTSSEPLWYSIADCVASVLLTGSAPRVMRAVRLEPKGRIRSMWAVRVRGTQLVDPSQQDPMVAMVEERQRVLRTKSDDATRLAASLKLVANSGSYGIYSEFNARERRAGQKTPVYVHARSEPFWNRVPAPEDPGRYCFPPFASCITGAARLMLAILERLVTDQGGVWAFCDTDSMAIVATKEGGLIACPSGTERLAHGTEAVRALSFAQVRAIQRRIGTLSPYDPSVVPELLKLEATSTCYAISAKRYALYNVADGEIRFIEGHPPSEHGLGQLRNPDPSSPPKAWIQTIWRIVLGRVHGLEVELPQWLNRPTMLRTTVSSKFVLRAFGILNRGRPYREQVKPFNFMLTAVGAKPPAAVPWGDRFRLVAPYETHANRWGELEFIDVHHPDAGTHRITTRDEHPDVARVDSFADVLERYPSNPEAKSLGPDGMPCGRSTVGLLGRRPVIAGKIVLIGKESNRLEERRSGELTIDDLDLRLTIYEDHDEWRRLVLPRLRRIGVADSASAVGMSERRMRDILMGKAMPHPRHRMILEALAADPAIAP